MAKKSIRGRPANTGRDVWKPYAPGHDAPSYYGIEFTHHEKRAVYDAIRERTGLNYVFDLMHQSMQAFGEAHGVPYCHTYCDDALIYCCIQIDIDYTQFPHNTPKLPIDEFYKLAARKFTDFRPAKNNEIAQAVQRVKLIDSFTRWHKENGRDPWDDRYESPDFDALADRIAKQNAKRPQRKPLRLVVNNG
jgi:hypothetical protein